jgi:hypothetical protein
VRPEQEEGIALELGLIQGRVDAVAAGRPFAIPLLRRVHLRVHQLAALGDSSHRVHRIAVFHDEEEKLADAAMRFLVRSGR